MLAPPSDDGAPHDTHSTVSSPGGKPSVLLCPATAAWALTPDRTRHVGAGQADGATGGVVTKDSGPNVALTPTAFLDRARTAYLDPGFKFLATPVPAPSTAGSVAARLNVAACPTAAGLKVNSSATSTTKLSTGAPKSVRPPSTRNVTVVAD